jgi:ubiquinone/menaquinone biosynthesis C-methylase UbiE
MAKIYNLVTAVIAMGGNGRAQRYFLSSIRPDSRVLTVGCGPSRFNELLAAASDSVTYLDIAPEMLAITERRVRALGLGDKHRFVCKDVMEFEPESSYDVVLANFFLNTFEWEDCQKVLAQLVRFVAPAGILCIGDEVKSEKLVTSWLQSLPRTLIFRLHKVLADQPMHPIYDYEPVLTELGFQVRDRQRVAGDGLMSTTYCRTPLKTPRRSAH